MRPSYAACLMPRRFFIPVLSALTWVQPVCHELRPEGFAAKPLSIRRLRPPGQQAKPAKKARKEGATAARRAVFSPDGYFD